MFGSEPKPRTLQYFETSSGRCPFEEWMESLDKRVQANIDDRLLRITQGNFGMVKNVGQGVKECKVNYGPGYRIYFGEDRNTLVVLLCGGDKGSQDRDIKKAQSYWAEYLG